VFKIIHSGKSSNR